MPGLFVHRSNRLEALADRLAALLRDPLPDPLAGETVVVQSLGMRRWLGLELAQRLGVTMNCDFPFADALAHRIFSAAFPRPAGPSAFSRDLLPWRIFALLPQLTQRTEFAALAAYIGADEFSAIKRFQLSNQLATLFDGYLGFRPGDLLTWQHGREEKVRSPGWPTTLWRELVRGFASENPPALLRRLEESAARDDFELPGLPARLSIFGISSLPPYYISLLPPLSRAADVHLFLFEPTDEYWGDIQSPREQRRFLRRNATPRHAAPDFHLDTGNALLASFGKPGRQFARRIQELDPHSAEELFEPPAGDSLVSRVQRDIFNLTDRTREEREAVAAEDRSIQIHCCHGKMREMEVLHDQLLELMQNDSSIAPKDILVMAPNIEEFAPLIQAVFGAPEDEALRIPFTIADRSSRTASAACQALLQLLALHGSRFGAAAVLTLIEMNPVRKKFGLDEAELETIRRWVAETGIRWGIDGKHRTEFGVPDFEQNSWRAGIDRLLLGYALPPEENALFDGIAPWDGMEGSAATTLGRFADFTGKLFDLIPALAAPRKLTAWARALLHLIENFIDESEDGAEETRSLRATIEGLADITEYLDEALPFEIVRAHLAQALGESSTARGFLAGRLTFCSMKPMRSIPFRVVCIAGLNDSDFPRRDANGALDRLAGAGTGGPTRREEDRHVFMEALLSARSVFYLSYSGLSSKDNNEAPPSVVISELLDYLDANYACADGIRGAVSTKHRLQPFSTDYFTTGGRLFSYSAENLEGSRALLATRKDENRSRFESPVPLPPAEWSVVTLEQLQRFYKNPCKYFLKERLRLRLPDLESAVGESEPMTLDRLERWKFQKDMTDSFMENGDAEGAFDMARAIGSLPAGLAGETAFEEFSSNAEELTRRIRAVAPGKPDHPHPFDLSIGSQRLTGSLAGVHAEGLAHFVCWAMKPKDLLNAWVEHLILNVLRPRERAMKTWIFARDGGVTFGPVSAPEAALEKLLGHYARGLREPLPFFSATSYEFAKRTVTPGDREGDLDSAVEKVWERECDEVHMKLCFRRRDALSPDFEELALDVYSDMLRSAKRQ